jgi:predicted RNase H-like HicB family nuclease
MIENYAIVVFWSEPDHAWIADAPDLESCSAHGATPEEAISELNIAMAAWFDAARAHGHALPEARFRQILPAAE